MSKKKNVHPDHYKTGGSLRQGEDVDQRDHRERAGRERARIEDEGHEHEPLSDEDEDEEEEER